MSEPVPVPESATAPDVAQPTADAEAIVRSPWRGADPTFRKMLLGSLVGHFVLAATVAAQPMPVTPETVEEVVVTRQGRFVVPLPKPKPAVAQAPSATGPSAPAVATRAPSGPRRAPATVDKDAVLRHAGLLGVIGSAGVNGSFVDVLDGSNTAVLAKALDGATAGKVASVGTELRPRDGSGAHAETIGPIGARETAEVRLGEHAVAPPRKNLDLEIPLPKDPPSLEGLAKFVAARKKAVQSCYERELRRNPSLQGRIVVRLHLEGPGRPAEVDVDDEGLGSDSVASCVRTIIRSWDMPFGAKADVELPFLFNQVQ